MITHKGKDELELDFKLKFNTELSLGDIISYINDNLVSVQANYSDFVNDNIVDDANSINAKHIDLDKAIHSSLIYHENVFAVNFDICSYQGNTIDSISIAINAEHQQEALDAVIVRAVAYIKNTYNSDKDVSFKNIYFKTVDCQLILDEALINNICDIVDNNDGVLVEDMANDIFNATCCDYKGDSIWSVNNKLLDDVDMKVLILQKIAMIPKETQDSFLSEYIDLE